MATPLDRNALSAEERDALAPMLRCPKCGLESRGVRCKRCNAVKIEGCSGVCSACKSGGCDTRGRG